jgi:hypothetical protein
VATNELIAGRYLRAVVDMVSDRSSVDRCGVLEEPTTAAELLEKWREATRAAQLAERLAEIAKASVERSDRDALAAEEIARMAERAAKHAERAAKVAREASERATAFAQENRSGLLSQSDQNARTTRAEEAAARDRYHQAEAQARGRQDGDGSGRS